MTDTASETGSPPAARAAGRLVLGLHRPLQPDVRSTWPLWGASRRVRRAVGIQHRHDVETSVNPAGTSARRTRSNRPHDRAIRVDPDPTVGQLQRAPKLVALDGGGPTGPSHHRPDDASRDPRRTSVNRSIVPTPPVYGARRDDRLDAVKVLVQSVHGFADVLPRITDATQVRDRVRRVPAMPHVLHIFGVATVRRGVERLDHRSPIRDDFLRVSTTAATHRSPSGPLSLFHPT